MIWSYVCLLLLIASQAVAATRYVDPTLVSDCSAGDYNPSMHDCTGTTGDAYNTIAKGVTPMVAGDTLYLRGGTYPTTQRIDLQLENKSGSAGSYMTFAGYPGDSKPVLQFSEGAGLYGNIKARGNRGWLIFQDLVLDGVNLGDATGWQIRDGNHDFILRGIEIKNQAYNGLYLDGFSTIEIDDIYIHDARTTCIVGTRYHGFYVHHGTNLTITGARVESMPGFGGQVFPGPLTGISITNSVFYGNNYCVTSNNGGLVLFANSGDISDVTVSNSVIAHNGYAFGPYPGGAGGGVRILKGSTVNFSNVVLENLTVVDNKHNPAACTSTPCPDHEQGNAVSILSGVTGVTIRNSILTSNENASVVNYGTVTMTNNACTSGESCGSTNKVTVTGAAQCVISATPSHAGDLRLTAGTNPCVDSGTATASRPSPVGAGVDLGAWERGQVSSASVVAGYIELVTSTVTSGVLPASGITGSTVACVGCTGSPMVSSNNLKSGSSNVLQLTIAGISSTGSCTVSLSGSTNATDTLMIGGTSGYAQKLNSVSGLSVSGTCQDTSGVGGGVTASWSHFPLNEGSGTVANDDTGNARHGVVSSGVTWVNDSSGTGVSIPTDATYRHVSSTYGSGIDPSTQDFAVCALVTIDSMTANKVVFSSSTNGTGQRWYAGPVLVGGQLQWGIGIKTSGFTTGSEFVVTTNQTLVCLVNDATADTATLWVNGVKGTGSGTSVKSLTSYALTGNLIAGNDGTNAVNNGGFTIYEFWVWNTKPTDQNIVDLYASLTPTSGTSPCLAQTHRQWEEVYTDQGGTPVAFTPKTDGSLDVVAGGGVAFRVQYTCTGTAGDTIAPRLYYSLNGTDFQLPVPQVVGAEGVASWGSGGTVEHLNVGASSGCLDATGLTANSGVTVVDAVAGQTFTMAQDHCRSDRYLVRVGNVPNTSLWFRVHTDAGRTFANGYAQEIKINVIEPQGSGD